MVKETWEQEGIASSNDKNDVEFGDKNAIGESGCGQKMFSLAAHISLTRGKCAVVDADDAVWIAQYRWYATSDESDAYAMRRVWIDGKRTTVYMHREIMYRASTSTHTMEDWSKKLVDHANGNRLDNRKDNLRLCSSAANNRNQQRLGGSSRYKGVSFRQGESASCSQSGIWKQGSGRWIARIQAGSKQQHLGSFETELEAAHAYDIAARLFHGEFARLNFPAHGEDTKNEQGSRD